MVATNPKSQNIRSLSRFITPSEDKNSAFWQQWQAHQEHLYQCCLKWTKSNPNDPEDILSQAMLKSLNAWQKAEGQIKYPKPWFTQILYNLCMDAYRKNKREALTHDNCNEIKWEDYPELSAQGEFLESNILEREIRLYLRHQIESLPTQLREPFLLYYCQDKSYQEIAQQLACSEANVRKYITKVRSILKQHLIQYIAGEDDAPLDSLLPSFNGELLMLTISQDEDINYQVTLLCQESLPHHWYSGVNPWSWR